MSERGEVVKKNKITYFLPLPTKGSGVAEKNVRDEN